MTVGAFMIGALLSVSGLEASSQASDANPEFTAVAVRSTYSRGEPVLVQLTFANNAQPAGYEAPFFVVIPRLTFGPSSPDWPYLQVAFSVTGPDGRPITPKYVVSGLLAEPQASQFGELHAGAFFGRTVDLSAPWLGFAFPTPGKYTVRATLSTGARRWLDRWLTVKANRKRGFPFSSEHVWQNMLEATPIEIVIAN